MKISIFTKNIEQLATPALVITVPQDKDRQLPPKIQSLLPQAALQSFKGKAGELITIFPSKGKISRVILVGLGRPKGDGIEQFRRSVGKAARAMAGQVNKLSIYLGPVLKDLAYEAASIPFLATYRYEAHKSKKNDQPSLEILELVAPGQKISLKKKLERAAAVASGVKLARNLANAPSNIMTPTKLAQTAQDVATNSQIECQILGPKELKKQNFGALLAVAQGSHEEPQLIMLDYRPKGYRKTIVLVGKGVTFDTGGINIKPSAGLDEMKMDMAGGAAVIGAMQVIAELGLKTRVVGIIPATENMPSGRAIKPSDIITSKSGLTIEVANTDAEGRMILADGLTYAEEFSPDLVLDLATLTGAAIVALGHERGAVIGNDEDLLDAIIEAGEQSGELVWPLPLDDDYRAHVKSQIADVKNLGLDRAAGTIAGAAFLEKFVPKNTPWAHIDLAGPAIRPKATDYEPAGGTGWGVRLLINFLESISKK